MPARPMNVLKEPPSTEAKPFVSPVPFLVMMEVCGREIVVDLLVVGVLVVGIALLHHHHHQDLLARTQVDRPFDYASMRYQTLRLQNAACTNWSELSHCVREFSAGPTVLGNLNW